MTDITVASAQVDAFEGYEELAARFRPLFAQIGEGVRDREASGTPPQEQLQALIAHGFAGLRVPVEHGGGGIRLVQILRLIAELAEADPNLAHIWRNHLSFIEDRLHDPDDPRSADWLRRLGAGEVVGGGWSEPAAPGVVDTQTTITEEHGIRRLTGRKLYSTGSIYATWSTVLAYDPAGEKVVALIPTDAEGVTIGDDWDGFGQRLTGSGSVTYDRVRVPDNAEFVYAERYRYQEQFYQSTLNALLVGIGRAVIRDGLEAFRARVRSHRRASTQTLSEDPQLLEVFGRLFIAHRTLEAQFLESLRQLDTVAETDYPAESDLERSWLDTTVTQVTAGETVLDAATKVLDVLGSSGTSSRFALDRHWRNARTIVSHNPRIYKHRFVGDWLVNGVSPTAV
ncbi:acyl-CoA dehydrogenase family protein [Microbacterium sp. ZW T5_45]|uniref:acyl-CoA dehydrogenase family protein n=1 Tax=Microbacterium sp. ZW T5_45 TaxID=3378080 RepID=UPI003851D924